MVTMTQVALALREIPDPDPLSFPAPAPLGCILSAAGPEKAMGSCSPGSRNPTPSCSLVPKLPSPLLRPQTWLLPQGLSRASACHTLRVPSDQNRAVWFELQLNLTCCVSSGLPSPHLGSSQHLTFSLSRTHTRAHSRLSQAQVFSLLCLRGSPHPLLPLPPPVFPELPLAQAYLIFFIKLW